MNTLEQSAVLGTPLNKDHFMEEFYERRFQLIDSLIRKFGERCAAEGIEPVSAFQVAVVENLVNGALKHSDKLEGGRFLGGGLDWHVAFLFSFLRGFFLQAGLLVGGFLQGQVCWSRSKGPRQEETFILKDVADTTTSGAVRYLRSLKVRTRAFLNMTPGIVSCLPRNRTSQILPEIRPIRPARLCDWPVALGLFCRHAFFLFRHLRSFARQGVLRVSPRQLSVLFGHVARGAVYWHWACSTDRSNECYVCTHLQMDAAYLDAGLRERGAKTVHWLHGTVEYRHKFLGDSSVCVTPTLADADLLRKHSTYSQVVTLPGDPLKTSVYRPGEQGHILLLTNFLHTHHQAPLAFRHASLLRLLQVVSCLPNSTVVWRPHPSERRSPLLQEIMNTLDPDKYQLELEGTLDDSLVRCGTAVSTFSGAIGDIVRKGRIPLVWKELRYESHGLWSRVPVDVLFEDEASFRRGVSFVMTPGLDQLHAKMWEDFHCSAANPPPENFFSGCFPA